MKLKVCGLRDPKNIEQVLALSPDYMGFIFYKGSPRYVNDLDPKFVSGLKGVKKVGVFVNEDESVVLQCVRDYALDVVQLHGNETPALCSAIGKSIPVIKAFQVGQDFDFDSVKKYKDCNYFLFDSKSAGFGGSGQAFDHRKLDQYKGTTPYFLSGGISLENIDDIGSKNIYSLDVNSRFELTPGIKDIKKLRILKEKLRS